MEQLASDVNNPDGNLLVKFYNKTVLNKKKTLAMGSPQHDAKVFVSIIVPGDMNNKVDTIANDQHKERFYKQWATFQRGETLAIDGVPLESWPKMTRERAEDLKYMKFYTVEQIAAASDAIIQKIGPDGYSLREQAKAYLAVAKDTAAVQKYADENLRLQREIDDLKAQFARINARFEEGSNTTAPAVAPKKRGRPPKVRTVEASDAAGSDTP